MILAIALALVVLFLWSLGLLAGISGNIIHLVLLVTVVLVGFTASWLMGSESK